MLGLVTALGCGLADLAAPPPSALPVAGRPNAVDPGLPPSRPGATEGPAYGRPPCLDTVAPPPPPHSGGEPLLIARPCFVAHAQHGGEEEREVRRQRVEAQRLRVRDARLRDAEARACDEIGAAERSHGPFFHRPDLRSVEPLREGGVVRGARIRFHEVSGLTVSWLRSAVTCHLARADALGYDPAIMPECPLWIPGVVVEVSAPTDGLIVDLRAPDETRARAVLRRAQALMGGAR